jgi:hypothetical protein
VFDLVELAIRPKELIPAPIVCARHIDDILMTLRCGEADIQTEIWLYTTDLELALIDDFDSQAAPEVS